LTSEKRQNVKILLNVKMSSCKKE